MVNVRIKNLPADATPNKNDLVPLDNATTRAATIEAIVKIGRPFASQAEAEAGADFTTAMNPLTVKQAIAAQGAVAFATAGQGSKADTAVQPGALGTAAATNASDYATAAQGGKADITDITRAEAILKNIPPVVTSIRTNGYAAAGDGGGALHKKVETEPTHAGKFQSADGAWWELAGGQLFTAEMFGAKTGDASVDNGAIINLATAFSRSIHLGAIGTYYTKSQINLDNRALTGARGGSGFGSEIRGVAASLPAGKAIVTLGGAGKLHDVNVSYDTLTGSEAKGERIGVAFTGLNIHAQRGTSLDRFHIFNCGTCIGVENDKEHMPFSVSIGVGEIGSHSFAGVDLFNDEVRGPTGNFIENVYINGFNTYAPAYGFRYGGGVLFSGFIGQLNIEHQTYTQSPVQFYNCAGTQVASLHIEGVKLQNANTDLLYIEGPQPIFGSVTAIHNGAWGADCGLVGFGETQQTTAVTSSSVLSRDFRFKADAIMVRGLLRPDPVPDGYPVGVNDYVSRAPGFRWFTRRVLDGVDPVIIDVEEWNFELYSGGWATDANELQWHRNPWFYSQKSGLLLERLGTTGPCSHTVNLLADPEGMSMKAGAALAFPAPFTTDGVSVASSGTASGSVTREVNANGVSFLIDPGATAVFQSLDFLGPLPASFRGGYVSVYFEMEAVDADATIEQARVQVFNRSDTNTKLNALSVQIVPATTVLSGQSKPINATVVLDMGAFVYGTRPTIALVIQMNDVSHTRNAKVRVRNVSLAVGRSNPAFSRPVFTTIRNPS